ncbi:hypothetical protein GCM10010218_31140 [Streptomyces mashuensis]|uniref:Uncharacterized protein n=1 Tax=Streptomyces mashuensis TaxID=33904 RepID=A0A919B3L7_9ACTN|nr:hypothetical protein GCM10010218_31140 [Streptomyces mashuensis]
MARARSATAHTVGRLMRHCEHQAGWTHAAGRSHCRRCGVLRFTDYGALRPPRLPQRTPF